MLHCYYRSQLAKWLHICQLYRRRRRQLLWKWARNASRT